MSMPKIESTDINRCSATAALLQSIALEEAAISHILNAEGEKIQKVLSLHSCDCTDILEVNKSVQETIDKITQLEVVLKAKLDLIVPLLEDCCEKKKHPKDDKCNYPMDSFDEMR